jgi:PTH1 family peptidyl-tRNA hydrolase
MRLFVGLGNPGGKYANNRHNIGFMAVDEVARRHGFAPWRRRFQGETSEGTLDHEKVVLLRPTTYMNDSGRAVQEAANFFKLAASDITAFHDELELPPAKVRVKVGGGIAGHNGLRSISSHIGNDYRRVRLGIGHPGIKELVHGHVLSDFAKSDRPWVERCARRLPTMPACLRWARLDVSEQGASGDAGQGIFEKATTALRNAASRRKQASRYGIQMRYRRLPNVGKSTLLLPDGNGGGRRLIRSAPSAECRRGRGAGRGSTNWPRSPSPRRSSRRG